MNPPELAVLACCDLGAIVRGRAVPAGELREHLRAGVGWVPANMALTPLGPLAEPNPFGSRGDLRLLPDPDTHVRFDGPGGIFESVLCDIVGVDGEPWECCPRRFLREALAQLEHETGAQLLASFEHEFQVISHEPPALPFSLEAQRRAEPLPALLMRALADAGLEPELIFPEFAPHQFEVPLRAVSGVAAADRAVQMREVVREVARASGGRASFAPLLDPAQAGNGVHIHFALLDGQRGLFYDAGGPAGLSELGLRFAAGVLVHARALSALSAPSAISGERLRPHHWSAGAVALAPQNREALLRVPPLIGLGQHPNPERQLRLEFRGADAAANPYLVLGGIVLAGLAGIRAGLPAPDLLEADPATLAPADAERFGVGALPASLAEALDALAEDGEVRSWMPPLLYEGYLAVKQAELGLVGELDVAERCRRYAAVY